MAKNRSWQPDPTPRGHKGRAVSDPEVVGEEQVLAVRQTLLDLEKKGHQVLDLKELGENGF